MKNTLMGAVVAVLLVPGLALAADKSKSPAQQEAPGPATEAPPQAAPAPEAAPHESAAGGPTTVVEPKPVSIATVTNQTPEALATYSGLHVGVDLDHSVGTGTFVNPDYFASVGASLVTVPSYAFNFRGIKLSASAREDLSWEYSLPDSETGRRFDYSDPRLGLSAPAVFKEKLTGIALSPSVSLLVPISFASRRASTITVISGSLGLSRTFNKLDLSYRFAAARGFHARPVIGGDATDEVEAATGAHHALFRPGESVANTFGTSTEFSLSNIFDVGYRLTDRWSFGISYSLKNSFRYPVATEVDELTPKARDSNGNPVARPGFGRADKVTASIGASFALTEQFSVAAGIGTIGPPKTNDGQRFRFPFYDFVSPADNLTSFSLTFSALF